MCLTFGLYHDPDSALSDLPYGLGEGPKEGDKEGSREDREKRKKERREEGRKIGGMKPSSMKTCV